MVDVNLEDVVRALGLRIAQLTVDLAVKEVESKFLQEKVALLEEELAHVDQLLSGKCP